MKKHTTRLANGSCFWSSEEDKPSRQSLKWFSCASTSFCLCYRLARSFSTCLRYLEKPPMVKCSLSASSPSALDNLLKCLRQTVKSTKLASRSRKSKLKHTARWKTKKRLTLSFTKWSWFYWDKTSCAFKFSARRLVRRQSTRPDSNNRRSFTTSF